MAQVMRYYEAIQLHRARNFEIGIRCQVNAVGYAFGSIKDVDFRKFLEQFNTKAKQPNIDDNIKKMQSMNLPVEEI